VGTVLDLTGFTLPKLKNVRKEPKILAGLIFFRLRLQQKADLG